MMKCHLPHTRALTYANKVAFERVAWVLLIPCICIYGTQFLTTTHICAFS